MNIFILSLKFKYPFIYFRLNVFPVKVPPLRERIDELPLLIDFFIKKYAPKIGKVIRGYSDSFFNKLKIYSFPGNIRELENIVERSIILSNDDILDGSVLPDFMEKVASESELDIRNNEKNLILKALAEAKYNKTRAAEILGISRRTLHNKIKEYNLEV